jgi:methylated-DNA-protein-cysteine methyltransferase related protein
MSNFNDKVYQIVRKIPYGRVMTYGQIAAILGVPRAARGVGWALHLTIGSKDDIPCQRVVNRFGGLASGYDWGGQVAHKADLVVEGVEVSEEFTVDLKKYQWHPEPDDLADLALSPDKQIALDQLIPPPEERLSPKGRRK